MRHPVQEVGGERLAPEEPRRVLLAKALEGPIGTDEDVIGSSAGGRAPETAWTIASIAAGPTDGLRRSTQVFRNRNPASGRPPGNSTGMTGKRWSWPSSWAWRSSANDASRRCHRPRPCPAGAAGRDGTPAPSAAPSRAPPARAGQPRGPGDRGTRGRPVRRAVAGPRPPPRGPRCDSSGTRRAQRWLASRRVVSRRHPPFSLRSSGHRKSAGRRVTCCNPATGGSARSERGRERMARAAPLGRCAARLAEPRRPALPRPSRAGGLPWAAASGCRADERPGRWRGARWLRRRPRFFSDSRSTSILRVPSNPNALAVHRGPASEDADEIDRTARHPRNPRTHHPLVRRARRAGDRRRAGEPASYSPVTDARLLNPEPQNWLMYRRTYRWLGLQPARRDQHAQRRRSWCPSGAMSTGHGRGPPGAADRQRRRHVRHHAAATKCSRSTRRPATCSGATSASCPTTSVQLHPTNRGVALYGDKVYIGDRRTRIVVALDAKTGKVVWEQDRRRLQERLLHDARAARRQGQGHGRRLGRRAAASAASSPRSTRKTGKEVWRTYTIPGPGRARQRHLARRRGRPAARSVWITGQLRPASSI